MKLSKFRVTDFRSVKDSEWIDVDHVTALIGVNESGKTNLLLPLWKFRPAREGNLEPTADYPKKLFGDIRKAPGDYTFIETEFDTSEHATEFSRLSGYPADQLNRLIIGRKYNGEYRWNFPDAVVKRQDSTGATVETLKKAKGEIESLEVLKGEADLKAAVAQGLEQQITRLSGLNALNAIEIKATKAAIEKILPAEPMKTSVLVPSVQQLASKLSIMASDLSRAVPTSAEGMWDHAKDKLPRFVYYSNYGNLDSEIYLPHVVENLNRDDLGAKEAAKARTLRVLFKFVGLEPEEILELGREFKDPGNPTREPTDEEIEAIAKKKKERSILLQSAGSKLTEKFKEWWKQGDYRFRFEADGNHFRIWVSDDLRPEEIELENRSTGLQWFLSFYLVFLVESEEEHANAFLLLDEPGLSLHPLAQRDLSAFFDNLADTNQLIYTTHSPFLIDADQLHRARKVYVGDDGTTRASSDLRAGADGRQGGASYAVYSALNLSVAESLLLGCQPIIVEGPSDQHYLTTAKTLLIAKGDIQPTRELVFPPSGGVRTAKAVSGMLMGRDETLPKLFLDGDGPGKNLAKSAKSGLYAGEEDKVSLVTDFLDLEGAEVEDLFPPKLIIEVVDRLWRTADSMFEDHFESSKPITGQVEAWAAKQGIDLPNGWKVEIAKEVKKRALQRGVSEFDAEALARLKKVFEWFLA